MSTVYIHVGTPKTGTTAIQEFLELNRTTLAQCGIGFPILSVNLPNIADRRNGNFLKYNLNRDSLPRWDDCMRDLLTAISEHDRVILSDETLWGIQKKKGYWQALKKELDTTGCDIKVIVYLRRQIDLVESYWNQLIKGHKRLTLTFDEYIKQKKYSYLPLFYDKALERIERVLGERAVIVRPYEFGQFYNGNIYSDFMHIFDFDDISAFAIPEKKTINTSMPMEAVEVKRLMNTNAFYATSPSQFFVNVIDEAYPSDYRYSGRYSIYSTEQRMAFMEQFEEGNIKVAKKYLGRADGILFEDSYDSVKKWSQNDRLLMEEAVRILAGSDMLLLERIEALEKENKRLKRLVDTLSGSLPGKIYKALKNITA